MGSEERLAKGDNFSVFIFRNPSLSFDQECFPFYYKITILLTWCSWSRLSPCADLLSLSRPSSSWDACCMRSGIEKITFIEQDGDHCVLVRGESCVEEFTFLPHSRTRCFPASPSPPLFETSAACEQTTCKRRNHNPPISNVD